MAVNLVETGYRAHKTGYLVFTQLIVRVLHRIMQPNIEGGPTKASLDAVYRRFQALLDRDYQNVTDGWYPKSLLFRTGLGDLLNALPAGVLEFPKVIARARKKKFDDLPSLPHAERFPRYYRRTFHWQTDGWFSAHSARMYDPAVDLLFGGTADTMRRMIIPDLARSLRDVAAPRILDVACGTGRFLDMLHTAMPDARLFGLDLSAPYLKHAQARLAHVPDVSLIADNAEAMPFADSTFDATTSIFLFHEMPSDVRRNVMREALRVTKPGGLFAVVDSAQLDDSAEIAWHLEEFPAIYHEPYFKGYIRDSLPAALREVGFEVIEDRVAYVSRVVVARKPTAPGDM